MIQLEFTQEDIKAFGHERFFHPHPRIQRRMEALWLKSQELCHNQICKLAGISANIIMRYLRIYSDVLPQTANSCHPHVFYFLQAIYIKRDCEMLNSCFQPPLAKVASNRHLCPCKT